MRYLSIARNLALLSLVVMAPEALLASDPECETFSGEYEGDPYFCIYCEDDSHLDGECELEEFPDGDPNTGSCTFVECEYQGEQSRDGICYEDPSCTWVYAD